MVPRERCSSEMEARSVHLIEATISDKSELAICLKNLDYIRSFTEWEANGGDEAGDELAHTDLPPNGTPEKDGVYMI